MMLHQNYKQIKLPNEFFVLPARISPKEISGANGKFLPKPLLFHLLLFLFWGNSGGQHKKAVSRFDLFEILA